MPAWEVVSSMEIKDRIKQLRKAKGLTQFEFADKLKVSRNNIAGYETGRTDPSASAISLICRTFSVSETWLRTGEGSMYTEDREEKRVVAFMSDALSLESNNFRKQFISTLAELNSDEWSLLEKVVKIFAAKEQEKRRD